MLNIVLVDDHAVVREGLKLLIDAQPDMQVVGEAEDGEKAWQQLQALTHHNPDNPKAAVDVVVMDIAMPNMGGVEATTTLRQTYPHLKVLALSLHEEKSYVRALFAAGANGYVLKRSPSVELLRGIRLVASGGSYLDPGFIPDVIDSLVHRPPSGAVATGAVLSEREAETLRLIAQGFANKEIAIQLGVSVKTIETYRTRGMEKLEMTSRAELVRYAVQHKWLSSS